jgi:hypothetical protein
LHRDLGELSAKEIAHEFFIDAQLRVRPAHDATLGDVAPPRVSRPEEVLNDAASNVA